MLIYRLEMFMRFKAAWYLWANSKANWRVFLIRERDVVFNKLLRCELLAYMLWLPQFATSSKTVESTPPNVCLYLPPSQVLLNTFRKLHPSLYSMRERCKWNPTFEDPRRACRSCRMSLAHCQTDWEAKSSDRGPHGENGHCVANVEMLGEEGKEMEHAESQNSLTYRGCKNINQHKTIRRRRA